MNRLNLFASSLLLSSLSFMSFGEESRPEYTLGNESFEGYWVSEKDNAPLVVLVHDWDGLTEYEEQRAKMLSQLGYQVFAVDMFGKGIRPTELADKKSLTGALYKDRDKMRAILQAGLDAVRKEGGNLDDMVLLGYCFGGSVIMEAARAGTPAKGFAGFHAGLKTPDGQDFSKARGSVILFHGSADKVVPMQDVADVVNQMESASVAHEVAIYSGARHAFSVTGSDRYDPEADKKSWSRFISYLDETL